MTPAAVVCIALFGTGTALVVTALLRASGDDPDLGEFLDGLGYGEPEPRLAEPFMDRFLTIGRAAVARRLERVLPRQNLERIRRQIAQAGLTGRRRAGEQIAMQLGLGAAGAGLALVVPAASPGRRAATVLLLAVTGFILPAARLKRRIRARSDAIFKDLPDIVDMLAIAVEAGSGFEAALSLVCQNFPSPLTEELAKALQDMELGLPRREALQHLRDRVDLEVVRTLVLSLLQADALGVPIGRVLRSQAAEVRARRRGWAREKAGKLPVKIMFPLVLFIFPPILALVLGPAASSFTQLGS